MDKLRKLILEIEKYGIENNVPIMSKDTIEAINKIINDNKVSSVLEIGTAIGYSTICFASNDSVEHITSIERNNERYNIACNNVKLSKLTNVNLINMDAFDVFVKEKFDLIIIDAAKSQNIKFFEKFKKNLNENGIIIIDNLDFHGYVGNSENIKSKNLRQMVRKIEKFIDYLNSNSEFNIKYIKVGDTIGVCTKKNL